jgi:hypothetical protein
MKKGDLYPLVTNIPGKASYKTRPYYFGKFTGEIRAPKAGEIFLAGDIIEAHYTSADLKENYPIAKLIYNK